MFPESQSFALQRLKIKEQMLEANLYKSPFVAQKNKGLDLSTTEKVSEVDILLYIYSFIWNMLIFSQAELNATRTPASASLAFRSEARALWPLNSQTELYNAVIFSSTWHVSG